MATVNKPPKCCGKGEVVWVVINHNVQYWYCRGCKKEVEEHRPKQKWDEHELAFLNLATHAHQSDDTINNLFTTLKPYSIPRQSITPQAGPQPQKYSCYWFINKNTGGSFRVKSYDSHTDEYILDDGHNTRIRAMWFYHNGYTVSYDPPKP